MRRKILLLFILSVISVNLMSCGQFRAQKSFSTSGDSIETAIPMEETSLTNLAPVNKWVKTTSTSIGGDMKCEDIYIRVKKVSTAENDYDYIKTCVDENNGFADAEWYMINEDDINEMNIVDWEIYVPEEYSSVRDGMVDSSFVTDSFDAVDFEDNRLPSFDLSCLQNMLLQSSDDDYIPAGTICPVRSYYYNLDKKEYCFRNLAKPSGVAYDADVDYVNAYFAIK